MVSPHVSIYKNIYDVSSKYKITVIDALLRIKNGRSKNQILSLRSEINEDRQDNLKSNLPSITFSGVFSERVDEKIIQHSGFICLDFDDVDIDEYRKNLQSKKYTYACWVSPRGTGVKILVKIADGSKHRGAFLALKEELPDADPSCVNESRVCYESFDPDLYLNEESEVYTKYIEQELVVKKNEYTSDETYLKLKKWLDKKGDSFVEKNRNNYIFLLAGAMCRYGFEAEQATDILISEFHSTNFSEKEIRSTTRSAFKKNTAVAGTCTFDNEKFIYRETKYEVDANVLNDGYKPSDVIYGSEIFNEAIDIYDNGYRSAETTYIPQLDEYFKWKRREITLLTGIGNYGKSTYLLQLLLIKSLFDGYKWAIFSPEHNPASEFYFDLTEMLLGCACDGGNPNKPSRAYFDKAYEFVSNHFFYVYPKDLSPEPDYIKTKFIELILKEKVEGVIIDPFNQLDNDYKKTGGRTDKYLEIILSDFKKFATDNNMFLVVVAHPVKLKKEGNGNYPCPDVFDISDGAMWNNKMDNILSYHRPVAQTDPISPLCEHHSKKIRRQKTVGKKGMFDFELNRKRRRFYFSGFSPLDGNRFEPQVGTQSDMSYSSAMKPNEKALLDFTQPIKIENEEDAPF